jgi:hypothetical protein
MKSVTNLMFNEFKMAELGMDFMGFNLNKKDIITFHHLIIPNRNGGPVARWNGAIIQRIPHDYLHLIERVDYDMFSYITSEMIDMNHKGFLDVENIKNIHAILDEFEDKYDGETTRKGKLLIKREYKQGRAVL